ncbi:7 transmembrane receptor [Cooperia oncophora]
MFLLQVLGVYVPGLIGWLISLEWLGGPVLCKVMRFIDAFVLAIRWILATSAKCLTIWAEKINLGPNRSQMTNEDFSLMKLYGIQNACITFYIPLVILVVCYVLILKDIYKTLNSSEPEMSSAWFISDLSKQSSLTKKPSKKDLESAVSLTTRTLRGQDKLSRAKVRSLRITLLLILVYVITWLPNNLLSWWMVISFDSYRDHQDATFPLAFLVVLNSVINPFIYGRCKGLKMMLCCRRMEPRQKKVCNIL